MIPRLSRRSTPLLTILSAVVLIVGCAEAPEPGDTDRAAEATQDAERRYVILATTTSTQDSGLLDVLLPDVIAFLDAALMPAAAPHPVAAPQPVAG